MLALTAPATAGFASSDVGYFTVKGVTDHNRADVRTSSGWAVATTSIGAPKRLGVGSLGANARLDTSNGVLRKKTGDRYSTSPAIVPEVQTPKYAPNPFLAPWESAFYSYGVTRAWNRSGYSPCYTLTSRYQNR